MDEPTIGIHPEGDKGFWVFRIAVPGIGQISRGEVTVNTTLAEEELPIEVQKSDCAGKGASSRGDRGQSRHDAC